MNDMDSWRIVIVLLLCLAVVGLVQKLGQSVQYRLWIHGRNKRSAKQIMDWWSAVRAGEEVARSKYEKKLTVMSEYQYVKEVRNMLYEYDLHVYGDNLWGEYTRVHPFATIPIKWEGMESEDKVTYQHNDELPSPPPSASKKQRLTVSQ